MSFILTVSPDRGGQQNHMGKYCLHFHHAGQCADCVFMGNAIYEFLVSQVNHGEPRPDEVL
jgi:hypothetical protein